MKIILVLAALLLLSAAGFAQSQYNWSELQYHYQTGSVPPPYYFEYDIYLNYLGNGQLVYRGGYSSDQNRKDSTYDFTAGEPDIKALNDLISQSGVLTKEIEQAVKHPIGGALNNMYITLTQDPKFDRKPIRIEIPTFPKSDSDKKTLHEIYEKIRSLVPQSVWDDLESKKTK